MTHHSLLSSSHIFNHWERDGGDQVRRSPRFTPSNMPLSASRRSPSFTMFSPPAHAQAHYGAPPHHMDMPSTSHSHHQQHSQGHNHGSGTHSAQSSRPGSTVQHSRNLRDTQSMLTSPGPNSPNLSILGKLRSLHHGPTDMSLDPQAASPHIKAEEQQIPSTHQHRSTNSTGNTSAGKRGRSEFEASSPFQVGSPSYHYNQKHTPHFSSYGVSPAMVGSLPPQQHLSLVDVPAAEMSTSFRSPTAGSTSTGGGGGGSGATPSKRNKHKNSTPRPRVKQEESSDDQPDEDAAASSDAAMSVSNGSGSSCHQVRCTNNKHAR